METLSGLREIFLKTLVFVDPDIIQSLVKRWNEECDKIYENTRSLNAEALSKAKSGTAKEIFAEVGKILTAKYNSIQAGCHHRMRFGNADTPQGMKELGELSGVRQVIAEIKVFEKKYTEATDANH
jgi:hypothetical protein